MSVHFISVIIPMISVPGVRTDALLRKHHLLVKREVLRKLVTTADARAKPPYVIRPNMTRKRGNPQGGEGKDERHLGNRQLGTHAVKTPETPPPRKAARGEKVSARCPTPGRTVAAEISERTDEMSGFQHTNVRL